MTNEEGERPNDIANEYWEEFGQLVARHLTRAPQHLRDELPRAATGAVLGIRQCP